MDSNLLNKLTQGSCLELIPQIPDTTLVNCVVTDPPYGVDYVSKKVVNPRGEKWVKPVASDGDVGTALELYSKAMDLLLPKCTEEAEWYTFTRWDILPEWIMGLREIGARHGFRQKMLLIWDKNDLGMGDIDGNWGCSHEMILYFKRGNRRLPERRSSIISVQRVDSKNHIHPTQKPVTLLEKLIAMSTDVGQLVVDPFAGSGSTLLAARNLGRNFIGFELDEMHAKRANDRLAQTGFEF